MQLTDPPSSAPSLRLPNEGRRRRSAACPCKAVLSGNTNTSEPESDAKQEGKPRKPGGQGSLEVQAGTRTAAEGRRTSGRWTDVKNKNRLIRKNQNP